MIKNEKQYKITKKLLVDWEENRRLLRAKPQSGVSELIHKERLHSVEEEIRQLKKQVKEYEEIKTGKQKLSDLELIEAVPELLVKWRIACNLTQKQLAKQLGMHENQLQRYENTNYAGASLSTVLQVARVLRDYYEKRSA
jgi:ribosome-binding protein aMBF1 (putative translation factor)